MDIKEKQAIWLKEKPLFEAELIHSHLLPFFTFNENTGDYEIKTESVNNTDDEDRKVAYESLNTGWAMWLRAKREVQAQAVPEINGSIQAHELAISEIKAEIEEGYDLCQDSYLLDVLVERGIEIGKIQAVPEGFVLIKASDYDQEMLELINQRDYMESQAEELKDKLQALYGVDFGEHSSWNFPFQNAIDYDDSDLVLVPKEPTEAMYIAGINKRQSGGNTADVYKAMIEAQEQSHENG